MLVTGDEKQPAEMDRAIRTNDIRVLRDYACRLTTALVPDAASIADIKAVSTTAILECTEGYELLSDISVCLIRSGHSEDLHSIRDIVKKLYEIENFRRLPNTTSVLINGLQKVLDNDFAIAMKHLYRVYTSMGNTVRKRDRLLCIWGMVTIALGYRDLELASLLIDEWRGVANTARYMEEIRRAERARRLIQFVLGVTGELPESGVENEVPLFIGIVMNDAGNSIERDARHSYQFPELLKTRIFHARDGIDDTGSNELMRIAGIYADWTLASPLKFVQRVLRERYPLEFMRAVTDGAIGSAVSEAIITQKYLSSKPLSTNDVVVWITDVRGYSSISERYSSSDLFRILGPLFRIINDELESIGGTVLEYIGDSVLVVFGAFEDETYDPIEILSKTALCLKRIREYGVMAQFNLVPRVEIGVGIQRGELAVGYLGGLRRYQLATLGNTVNVAARIEGLTRNLPCSVVVEESYFDGDSPNVWEHPENVGFSLRDLGNHRMKNISRDAHLYGIEPLTQFWADFVPMGLAAKPESGVVYIDVGNRCEPGVIDHHFDDSYGSTCEIVNRDFETLIAQHIVGHPRPDIEFRMHELPDIDCVASYYCACERLRGQGRSELLYALGNYVTLIDQGFFPDMQFYQYSLYGIFVSHLSRLPGHDGAHPASSTMLEHGLRVIDAAVFIGQTECSFAGYSDVFKHRPTWFREERAWLERDRITYDAEYEAGLSYAVRVSGKTKPVECLMLKNPKSALFKIWARNDARAPGGKGYPVLCVDWSDHKKARIVISVDPDSPYQLAGLGEVLERFEKEKREKLGQKRPVEPRRFPSDNADPWYFGQGHNYTIIDSPSSGTVLTPGEVVEIQKRWIPADENGSDR